MKRRVSFPVLSAMFGCVLCFASVTAASIVPSYQMHIRIEPASGTLEAKVEIHNPHDSSFILNKDMVIRRITADGTPVTYHENKLFAAPNFMPNTVEIVPDAGVPEVLLIEYGGPVRPESYPPMVNVANMINARLVEIAVYVAWYPKLTHGTTFTYQLEADLPANFVTVANGARGVDTQSDGRSLTRWTSYSPVGDIALIAAPGLQKTASTEDGSTIEIYYDKVPKSYVDSMKANLRRSMDELFSVLGPLQGEKLIRVVYSPRKTWGYVRVPLIIVSEDNALTWRSQRFGPARDFRYLTHEMSHYWWGFADAGTPDDWINEGLAEYSAFMVCDKIVGREFTDQLLSEYRKRASASKTETAIAETEGNSPDREVNRYDKPVLLFHDAREKYGAVAWDGFLKALHLRFASEKKATTGIFLDELGERLGPEAKASIAAALYAKKWQEPDKR